MAERTRTLLTCNIQAGSRTASYGDYITRGWSNVLPAGKRGMLDAFARLITSYDLVGLQESDPGSLRSGFMNQTHYLAQQSRSEEHTSELQSLMRISYDVFCLKTKTNRNTKCTV